MSTLSTTNHHATPDLIDRAGEVIGEWTGLAEPTIGDLFGYATSRGRKVSDVVAEAERIGADRDLASRNLDDELRSLKTVQDVAQYAEAKGLDIGSVMLRCMEMQRPSGI